PGTETASALFPRFRREKGAKGGVRVNEAEPFNCVRCGKPFGTRQMVDNMLGKLSGHSMFAGGVRRLQMCGDCRVVDMMGNKTEAAILDYPTRCEARSRLAPFRACRRKRWREPTSTGCWRGSSTLR